MDILGGHEERQKVITHREEERSEEMEKEETEITERGNNRTTSETEKGKERDATTQKMKRGGLWLQRLEKYSTD